MAAEEHNADEVVGGKQISNQLTVYIDMVLQSEIVNKAFKI